MFAFAQKSQPAPRVYQLRDARIAEVDNNDRLTELLICEKSVPFIPFLEISQYLANGYQYKLEPDIDHLTDNGNRIISLVCENDLKLAEVQYDPFSNKIYPPK
jgi:hypothetical protein